MIIAAIHSSPRTRRAAILRRGRIPRPTGATQRLRARTLLRPAAAMAAEAALRVVMAAEAALHVAIVAEAAAITGEAAPAADLTPAVAPAAAMQAVVAAAITAEAVRTVAEAAVIRIANALR